MMSTVLKLESGNIYINAEHRRKLLDKWVWLSFGDTMTRWDIFNCIKTGKGRLIDNVDVQYWMQKLKK